ncbi:MAG: hypothetical protein HC789_06200 [Microcoleus sp. CSU_2_2]|nr:hypothetical protein [Microcoleus sp. SU_5_3]NJS09992.1 hypothetical protein [Microcoleus sp. CSU_2_2]
MPIFTTSILTGKNLLFFANPEVKKTRGRMVWLVCEVSLVRITDRTEIATIRDR